MMPITKGDKHSKHDIKDGHLNNGIPAALPQPALPGRLTYRCVVVKYYCEKLTCNCIPDYAVILHSAMEDQPPDPRRATGESGS
ncbi:hypothetical protein E2C01_010476 [Portunus trituberculatus]|uniref:Uncharacterized protein n=1 Tax=Portunus trituberculatus TaxID=210409 RepID=A0A5B7D8K9_PORTR|nr:hypothetical protein [Portunus trituberculatus]